MLFGTKIANKAIKKVNAKAGLNLNHVRLYTELRKNDRTHKIYGRMCEDTANKLIKKLTKYGAINARVVRSLYGRCGISGVRFEVAKEG